MPEISIVSPVYGARKLLAPLIAEIKAAMEPHDLDYEIILVDDACPQNSWEEIVRLQKEEPLLRGIKLSRNFGQHYAISAGLEEALGRWVIVMDCDLQDDPAIIPQLYQKAKLEESKVVLCRRMNRKDSFIKKISSRLFHNSLSFLSGMHLDAKVANYGIYHRDVVNAILQMGDKIRYFPAMVIWVGFSKAYLDVEHRQRGEGNSSYNLKRLLRLAGDIILSFSDRPIRLLVSIGLMFSSLSFILMLVYLMAAIAGLFSVSGFASIMVSLWFLGGLILLALGIIGMYVGKSFEAVKDRPLYLIEQKIPKDEA